MCNASFHVDSAVRDDQVTNVEGVEPEVEIQEPEGQLYVGADQEQEPEPEQELTNFYNTQGKHRCMINLIPFTIESYNYYYVYALSL